ncbi:hypothetical protein [Asticcacaulis sp. AC402]|uniref:hypothetical protein n=1 Tax=Asticcacaulis sp. AC402 TaxID=1282361 RepID=UPI0003C3FF4F|nr:hypothetical protein [Asticcacaulis sp. AC402]ESQ74747.1 hypothetical protein ABAC402_12640 [Asticcacaulis sp. AC402]
MTMSTNDTLRSAPGEPLSANPFLQTLMDQTHAALTQASLHTESTASFLLSANETMAETLRLMGRESLSFSVAQLRQRIDDTQALMKTSNLGEAASLSASQTTAVLQDWAEASRRLASHWTAAASAYMSLTKRSTDH